MVAQPEPPRGANRFLWVSSGEPHAIRRRELLSKYGEQIRKLYGYDHATAYQVRHCCVGAAPSAASLCLPAGALSSNNSAAPVPARCRQGAGSFTLPVASPSTTTAANRCRYRRRAKPFPASHPLEIATAHATGGSGGDHPVHYGLLGAGLALVEAVAGRLCYLRHPQPGMCATTARAVHTVMPLCELGCVGAAVCALRCAQLCAGAAVVAPCKPSGCLALCPFKPACWHAAVPPHQPLHHPTTPLCT